MPAYRTIEKQIHVEQNKLTLMAEEGATLSSGSLRLYALPYGCVDLYAYDPMHRRAAVGIVVATAHRRQGHALAMLQALERQYKGVLHVLYADIEASNTPSLALFRKAGYTECGHFAEWLCVDGHYTDTVRLQKIL